MECNLEETLTICKLMNTVPNFSELSRVFHKDRHTIKKMYDGNTNHERKKKSSELDQYKDDIEELLSKSYVKTKAAYWYLKNEKNLKCTYDNFKTYVRKHSLRHPMDITPHPLYETLPGDMVQNDWVENIKLATINGEILTFNLFSATLAYSRYHYFEYSQFKTESDYKRCCVHHFQNIGGTPKRILTDNMSAIVNHETKQIHPSVNQFSKDLNVNIQLCKVRTPQTKGKDEASNKFAQWLYAYDGRIENKAHLLRIINQLNVDINRQPNATTNIPPVLLFEKEKEYLNPLPRQELLANYEVKMYRQKVTSTFVINYKGSKYSVPTNFINKYVEYKEVEGILYIYYNNELIAEHQINTKRSIVYKEEHYAAGLIGKFKNDDDIERITKENLARFKDFGDL